MRRAVPRQATKTAAKALPNQLENRSRLARDSLVVGVGLIALSAVGAVQFLLIAFLAGRGSDTDAFLSAFALYAPVALLGVSLRRTLVPLLGSPGNASAFRDTASEIVGRILFMAVLATLVLGAVAWLAAPALAPGLPAESRPTLRVAVSCLMLAAGMQICAGSIAAVLNALGRFPLSITMYVGAAIVALAASASLLPVIGVDGAAVGLTAGAAVLAASHLSYLAHLGIRPTFRLRWLIERRQPALVGQVLSGVALTFAQQTGLTFALVAVSAAGESVTLYSYAFFVTGVMLNLSAVPLSVTLIPHIVEDLRRRGELALEDQLVRIVPYMMIVLLPMLAAFAAFGRPIVIAVLGGPLSRSGAAELYSISATLSLMAIAASVFAVAGSMLLANRRRSAAVVVSVCTMAAQGVAVLLATPWGVHAIALAQGVGATVGVTMLLGALFGRRAGRVAWRLVRAAWPAGGLCAVFALGWVMVGPQASLLVDLVALVVTLIGYSGLALALWPRVARRFVGMPSRRGRLAVKDVGAG